MILMDNTEDSNVSKRSDQECCDNAYDYHSFDKDSLIEMLVEKDKLLFEKSQRVLRLEKELNSLDESKKCLKKELDQLRSELQHHTNTTARETSQEPDKDESIVLPEDQTGNGEKPMPEWIGSSTDLMNVESSISDVVRATAEAELGSVETEVDHAESVDSEYVYDPSSGYYYHPTTGYYWDPSSGLFYDYTSGTYYQYNDETGDYDLHSQVEVQADSISAKKKDTKRKLLTSAGESKSSYAKKESSLESLKLSKKGIQDKKKRRIKKKAAGNISSKNDKGKDNLSSIKGNNLRPKHYLSKYEEESSDSLATDESELVSDPESGEILSSNSSEMEMGEVQMYEERLCWLALEQTQDQQYIEAMAENYPPCIRAIVEESDKLGVGTLFIVTCTGGTIGRDADAKHTIEIPDIGVSKVHARIDYNYEFSCYQVTDLGSQNGTRVNGNRVCQEKSNNGCCLNHGDVLQLGGSAKLLLHIHKGHETCEECEPGQIQAKLKAANSVKNTHVVLSTEEKRQKQRRELKKIKKKYGLENSYFENEGAVPVDDNYVDKAYLRRKFIGSENEVNKEMPASVHSPISASNKGHRLLAKMGWEEGQGLGKTSSGIAEPINVELRVNQSAGLGSREGVSVSLDNVQDSNKVKRWSQARQRFNKLQTSTDRLSNNQTVPIDGGNNQVSTPVDSGRGVSSSSSTISPSSSSLPSSSTPTSSSKSQAKSTGSKPQILWHKGGTESLSHVTDDNKDS